MSKQNETVADIVAEKRRTAVEIEKSANGDLNQFQRELIADLRGEADRIEAAHKREIVEAVTKAATDAINLTTDKWKREVAVSKTETTTGNAAKVRAALVELTDKVLDYLHNGLIQLPLPIEEANAKARAALSATPRNCDIYKTEDEANTAWLALDDACDDALAPFGWLLAEAKEGGAK